MPSPKELAKALAYQGEIRNQPQNRLLGGVADALAPVSEFADQYKISDRIPFLGGLSAADLTGLKGAQSLVNDMSYGTPPIRGASLQTTKVDPRVLDLAGVTGAMMPVAKNLGKAALREGARQIETGTGIGRAVVNPRSPITTWHGSPHTFPPTANNPLGEFDPMKVGTGEGAQAYGVGAGYLAEAPAVAKGYRQTEGMYKRVTGGMTNKEEFIADHLSQGRPETSILDLYAQKYGGSFDDAMKDLINVKQMYGTGNLYKVDLPDEHVAKMLNWDKPLSEQHPSVQSALAKLDPDLYHPTGNEYSPDEVGAETYLRMANSPLAKNQSDASEVMRNAGITGIRYLDAASRDAAGKGTSNFVVFDPKHMNILERNGVGGAMIQRPKTEFEILHDTAQRNAALPVEQGGLGLPANNTYIDRANAPGMFPTDAYHATNVEFDSFDPSKTKMVNGVFTSTDPSGASAYVEAKNAGLPTKHEGGFVMPLRINNEKSVTPEYFNLNNIRSGLAEGNNVVGGDVVVIPNPKNIRSRFAAFDPMRRHEADILAGVGAGGMLDPQAIAEALRQQDRK